MYTTREVYTQNGGYIFSILKRLPTKIIRKTKTRQFYHNQFISMNAMLCDPDDDQRPVMSTELAINLVMRAEWLFPQIFLFHDVLKIRDLIKLRSSCKLFSIALRPPPLYVMFSHSKHATLQRLLNRLHVLYKKSSGGKGVPSLLFIEEGEYVVDTLITVKFPISIIGAGREKTTLVSTLFIRGKTSDGPVMIKDLTIKNEEGSGLYAYNGMKVIMRGCSIEDCQSNGLFAYEADISCDNLQVVGCGMSGVYASTNATITLSGEGTSIHGNVTKNVYSISYGLTADSSSKIQLIHPLTKETISTNNGGGGNWNERFCIEQIKTP